MGQHSGSSKPRSKSRLVRGGTHNTRSSPRLRSRGEAKAGTQAFSRRRSCAASQLFTAKVAKHAKSLRCPGALAHPAPLAVKGGPRRPPKFSKKHLGPRFRGDGGGGGGAGLERLGRCEVFA